MVDLVTLAGNYYMMLKCVPWDRIFRNHIGLRLRFAIENT